MRLLVAVLAMMLLPFVAASDPLAHPACDLADVVVFAEGQGVVENLLFDGAGSLFVTRDGDLWRYAPEGEGELYVEGIGGGLARGPDGALYAGVLNDAVASIQRTGASSVARIDLATGSATTFASGFDMANGLAFDGAGNLYVSNDFGEWIVRIAPDGSWLEWANVYSANGMAVADGYLYAALTFDQRSPIVAVALDNVREQRIVAELSLGALTLQPNAHVPGTTDAPLVPQGLDDMTLGPDGALYVAAQTGAGVLRVDRATGEACLVAGGMPNASSVRFANGFGEWDGAMFVTAFDGRIWAVR